jgi:rubrerythrin
MAENKTLDIIKGAILLEHRGKALYESVARQSRVEAVKDLFEMLVKEEATHIDILNKQFGRVANGEPFDVQDLEKSHPEVKDNVMSDAVTRAISGAGYEAAVIAAGLDFEKKAVEYYSQQAKAAGSDEEKQLFRWLADWETTHMQMFAQLDKKLREQVWYDNSFWPF